MLKLMRNLLAEKQILQDESGNQIKWDYLVKLERLQATEGLRAGNKLTERHISWTKQKMKVNLAAQTLSSSVADALEFCRDDLGMHEFQDCAATVRYIRILDRVFDLLNSRNPLAKGYKAPLRCSNEVFWRPFVSEAKSYLWELRMANGDRVCETNRKTGVIGLIACLTSYCDLFDKLVAASAAPLKYLLGYKFSQDHIELFFGAIRGRGGWNNNPTARQFKAAYKRLLVHQNVKAVVTGNCLPQEPIELLSISSKIEREQQFTSSEIDSRLSSVTMESCPPPNDHDYSDVPDLTHLSMFVENVVGYVAGFVVRKVKDKVCCDTCESVLTEADNDSQVVSNSKSQSDADRLLQRKNRGGLFKPSDDVVSVCKLSERAFRTFFNAHGNKPPSGTKIRHSLVNQVLSMLTTSDLFFSLNEHDMEQDVLNSHRVRLVKLICDQYFAVRFYHAGKVFTRALQGDRIRSVLTKTVIFKGQ